MIVNGQALEKPPFRDIGYANRGSAYNSLQRFEEASADYAKAVRLDPSLKKMIDPSKPLVDKAMSVIDEGDLDKAETLLTSAAKMNPKSAAAWNELAFIKSQKQDYPKCIELASKAIAIDGTNADALANRGGCRSGSGRYKEALADLDKAIDQLIYIARDTELLYVREATTEEDKRKRFIEFWAKRDPDPQTPRNELME